MRWLDDRYF